MKKLIICAIMILMFISCDLVNTGIPDFIATHGSGSTSAVAPVIVTDLSTDEMTYTQNNPATPLTIEATVTDGGTLTYAWYSNDEANTNSPIAAVGINEATYTPLTTTLGTLYYYYEVTNTIIDNGDGGVKTATTTSNFAMITVNDKVNAVTPVIEKDLSSTTYTLNAEAEELTIKAKAPDGGALTYAWYSNGVDDKETATNLETETKATYMPLTTTLGTRYYYCEVTNTIHNNLDGGVKKAITTSKFAKITVNEAVDFESATQEGGISDSVTTTRISIVFDKAITGLKADHITLEGATKGDLSGSGMSYTIAIRDITVVNGGTVKVAITGVPGYTITPDSMDAVVIVVTAVTPVISYPDGGNFDGSQDVTITSTTAGAKIYYTIDNTPPTTGSTLYTEEFRIGEATALSGTVEVRAIAVKDGMLNSAVATKTFTKKSVLATVLVGSADQSFDVGVPAGAAPTVKFKKDFYMGVSEVTQGQYYDVMTELSGTNNGTAGSRRPSKFGKTDTTTDAWRELPVEQVTWYEAIAFCNALSVAEGLDEYYTIDGDGDGTTVTIRTGLGYRLPTEAEWEYVAGGGATDNRTTYAGTNDLGKLGDYAWFVDNSDKTTHAVKGKLSNTLDLYDMSGNVFEWCWDLWDVDKYPSSNEDPTGPVVGTDRIIRGGSYFNPASESRVAPAIRFRSNPSSNNFNLGFRVVRFSSQE